MWDHPRASTPQLPRILAVSRYGYSYAIDSFFAFVCNGVQLALAAGRCRLRTDPKSYEEDTDKQVPNHHAPHSFVVLGHYPMPKLPYGQGNVSSHASRNSDLNSFARSKESKPRYVVGRYPDDALICCAVGAIHL